MRCHHSGQLAAAEEHYRRALSADPNHVNSLYCLGVLALQTGRNPLAVEMIGKALQRNDREPDWHYHIGVAYQGLGQAKEAEEHYRRAVALKPALADAHYSLGLLLAQLGRADDAAASYRQALTANPKHAPARNNLGNILASSGLLDQAAEVYRKVVELNPEFLEGYENLARTYLFRNQPAEGLSVLMRGFARGSTPGMQNMFVRCARDVRARADDPNFRTLMVRALSEPWGRPSELAASAISLIKTGAAVAACIKRAADAWPRRLAASELFGPSGLAALARDRLLLALLGATPVADVEIERFMTLARAALLARATSDPDFDNDALVLAAALAQQCFINEYVFALEPGEAERAQGLRDKLEAALASGDAIPAAWLVIAAAYAPLHALPATRLLNERKWPDALAPVLVQQVLEPQNELAIRAALPTLTPIQDRVSQAVAEQYEENPYPRWIKVPPAAPRRSLDEYLRSHFPRAPFQSLDKGGRIDILVAGCGTGQLTVELARNFPDAKLLAVDLSRASLSYAARKSREAGVTNVEFAQADILGLGAIGRSFDVIESSGVLHHMDDPFAGWRVLVSLLRPHGFMDIGLYSELARQDVVAARAMIAAEGYRATADDIRRFRQDLIDRPAGAPMKSLLQSGDFYATSACRDLLFHVQEHRLGLPAIKGFLAEQKLRLLGFNLPEATIQRYATRYGADTAADTAQYDIDRWHEFESENPNVFQGMYQFWVQREI